MTNKTQNQEENNASIDALSTNIVEYLSTLFNYSARDQQNHFPIRIAGMEFLPLEKVLTEKFVSVSRIPRRIVSHPDYKSPFSDGTSPLSPQESRELFTAVARDYTTSRLFKAKRVLNPQINFRWRDIEASNLDLDQKDFLFQEGKAYPTDLIISSRARTRKELEARLIGFQQRLEALKGKTFFCSENYVFNGKYNPNSLDSTLRRIDSQGEWADRTWVKVDYFEKGNQIKFVKDIEIHSDRGSEKMGIFQLEFVLPDGTALTREKVAQYHRQKAEAYSSGAEGIGRKIE